MNSIVQEASSIAKAVESAWAKAGKPQKFSIRILQDAEKNFFGLTTKPAQIAFLFETRDVAITTSKAPRQQDKRKTERPVIRNRPKEIHRKEQRPAETKNRKTEPPRTERPRMEHPRLERKQRPLTKEKPKPVTTQKIDTSKDPIKPVQQEKKEPVTEKRPPRELWTDEMVATARNWMKDMMVQLKKEDINFTTEVKRYHLKFLFSKPLEIDELKEKNIFRNFAHLIMQTVRNRSKKQFKYHKVVLTSER